MVKTIKVKPSSSVKASIELKRRAVTAADDDFDDGFGEEPDDTDGLMDAIDDVADNVADLQDSVDDVDKDSVSIALNNNITDHYIAECEECQGVFISAVIQSDQQVSHVSGVCPLCGKETDQHLKWVIKEAGTTEEVQ